jgi:signal transduction histidine kinase
MNLYRFFSEIAFARKKHVLKFLLIVFPVVLFALADLVIFVVMTKNWATVPLKTTIIVIFLLTLFSAISILYLFDKLTTSLRLARQALNNDLEFREVPNLPVHNVDEAGLLLSDIQATITQLDLLLSEKSDMIDLLSHDLRSPLSRIISLSSLIKTDTESSKNLYADYITDECKNLLRILENILLMLKEDGNNFKVVNVSLKKTILEAVAFFDFAVTEKNLQVYVTVDDSISVNVQQGLFTQVLRNLLGNAIKFSPDHKAIFISAKEEKDRVSLTLQDEGLGFAASDIHRMFERFTNAGKKGTHGESSTGLGLYLSRKIIEKHGGKLIAESKGINKGASFTIVLYQAAGKKPYGAHLHKVDQQGELFAE